MYVDKDCIINQVGGNINVTTNQETRRRYDVRH